MLRTLALVLCFIAAPALAQYVPAGRNCGTACYVSGDVNVPVFAAGNLTGAAFPSAETPTNFSMTVGTPIAQPAQQTGPAAATQSFTGSVSANTLTIASTLSAVLPNSTQILRANVGGCGATPTSSAPANCPVITGLLTGTGTAIGSTYSLSGTSTSATGNVAISTIPVGLNEDAIVSWDSVLHRQWDSGTPFGCVLANAIWGIDHVDFYLDGGTTPITATATTTNSESGAPDYCWAAPISLFNGHNGVHMVTAVVVPVVGWPVVMASNQAVSVGAATSAITVHGLTPVNAGTVTPTARFYQITGSSDTTTFPNASTDNLTNGNTRNTNFHGIYCVTPTDADHFGLIEASWAGRVAVATPLLNACSVQNVGGGTISTNTLVLTGSAVNTGIGGPVIKGQTVTGPGLTGTNTVTSVTGTYPTQTVVYSGTALSANESAQNYTFAGVIPSVAAATFTLTSFHAGSTAERANQNNGSDFFIVNGATGTQMLEVTAYASLTGSNANPATSGSPAATLEGAMKAITPTKGANQYFSTIAALTNIQAIATSGTPCTTFTLTGNTSGTVPFHVGMPVKYDGQTTTSGIFQMDAVYFVQSAAADVITLAATPGGACINDTALVAAASGTASFLYDYSETTLLAQHTGSGVNLFAYGDFTGTPATTTGGIIRFADMGYATIGWDPATATFNNVAIDTVGQSTSNSQNSVTGLGFNNLHTMIQGIIPTATVHLIHDIQKGATVTGVDFLASELPSNFPLVLQSQTHQGTHPTQFIPNGATCLPTSGSAQTVMVSATATTGTTQTLTLLGISGGSIGTGAATPVLPATPAYEYCPIGTPVTLADYWNYDGLNSLWFDNTDLVFPNPYMSNNNAPLAPQLNGAYGGAPTQINGPVISTNSSTFNVPQGMSAVAYMANSLIWGAPSAGTKGGTWLLTNSLIDRSGAEGVGAYSSVSGALIGNAYGVEEAVKTETATATLALSGNTATFTGVTGQIRPGMSMTGSCSPALPGGALMQQITNSPNVWTYSGSATITSCSVSLGRAIWHLAPTGNTTPGNYAAAPLFDPNGVVYWQCTGVAATGVQFPIWSVNPSNSTVIVSSLPSGACALDGSSYLVVISPAHIDLNTQLAVSNGFQIGWNISGLNIVNSMGYGWYILENTGNLSTTYNSFIGNSNLNIFPTINGQGSYADISLFGSNFITNQNFLARNTSFGFVGGGPITAQNQTGTAVWDGVGCGVNASAITTIGATIPGYVIRNTGWPGQGGLSAGSC